MEPNNQYFSKYLDRVLDFLECSAKQNCVQVNVRLVSISLEISREDGILLYKYIALHFNSNSIKSAGLISH